MTFRHLRPTICQRDVSKDLVHGDTISFRTRTIPVQEQKRVLCWPISGCVPPAWPRGCFCAGLVFILHLKQNCFPGFWSKPVYTHSLTFGHAKRRMSKPYVAFKPSCVLNSQVNMASNGVLLRHAVDELPLHLHLLFHLVYLSSSTSTITTVRYGSRLKLFTEKTVSLVAPPAPSKCPENQPATVNEAEVLSSFHRRYTSARMLSFRSPTAYEINDTIGRGVEGDILVIDLQFTGPQPIEGPASLLCNVLQASFVSAHPVNLGRGRKRKVRAGVTAPPAHAFAGPPSGRSVNNGETGDARSITKLNFVGAALFRNHLVALYVCAILSPAPLETEP